MKRQDIDYDKIAEQFLEENGIYERKYNFFSYFVEFIIAISWVLGGLLLLPFIFLLAKGESEEDNA